MHVIMLSLLSFVREEKRREEIVMSIKFSVIVPAYNRASTIERAIISLKNQQYSNFEVIIIDDGSSDNTIELIEPYLSDNRFKLVKLSENSGVNKARNTGFDNIARDSDWVTFLDSDDEFLPDALLQMLSVITCYPMIKDFCFSVVDQNGLDCSKVNGTEQLLNYQNTINSHYRPGGEFVHTISSDLIRNSTFRYEERVRNGFEIIAYFRLARSFSVLYSSNVVRRYFLDGEGLTRVKVKKREKLLDEIAGFEILMEEFGADFLSFAKRDYALFNSVIGVTYLQLDNRRLAIHHTKLAFMANKFELRVYRNFLLLLKSIFSN
jgi:glycosyltransferase involved in cell wall biosynthesis